MCSVASAAPIFTIDVDGTLSGNVGAVTFWGSHGAAIAGGYTGVNSVGGEVATAIDGIQIISNNFGTFLYDTTAAGLSELLLTTDIILNNGIFVVADVLIVLSPPPQPIGYTEFMNPVSILDSVSIPVGLSVELDVCWDPSQNDRTLLGEYTRPGTFETTDVAVHYTPEPLGLLLLMAGLVALALCRQPCE